MGRAGETLSLVCGYILGGFTSLGSRSGRWLTSHFFLGAQKHWIPLTRGTSRYLSLGYFRRLANDHLIHLRSSEPHIAAGYASTIHGAFKRYEEIILSNTNCWGEAHKPRHTKAQSYRLFLVDSNLFPYQRLQFWWVVCLDMEISDTRSWVYFT